MASDNVFSGGGPSEPIVAPDLVGESTPELKSAQLASYRRILHGSGYGFWEWDLASRDVEWYGGFWQALGYSSEDMSHIYHAEDIVSYIHPDDREGYCQQLLQAIKSESTFDLVYRVRTKKGGYCWSQSRGGVTRDSSGRALYLSGINFDVSRLKHTEETLQEAEARHARIIEAANDGLWEWSASGGDILFSDRCWEQLGFRESDEEVNLGGNRLRDWRSRIHPEDLSLFDISLKYHLEKRVPFDLRYRIYNKHGEICWIRARGKAYFDSRGRPLVMSGTNMDITKLKQAEAMMLEAKESAEEANRAKSEFLSSMSHELRTPLNAILGYAQLFELDHNLSGDQQLNVQEIRSAGEHLLNLINDVLDLAKIEAGRLELAAESILPARVMEECLALLQPLAESKGVLLAADLNALGDCWVRADKRRLKQVFLNLISNAVKYNRVGGRVDVSFSCVEGMLRIDIADTGVGIAADKCVEVFQPFNRLGAEASDIEGTGVGLVITKRLLEMMKGDLDFSSREGQGTTFWLTLPISEQQLAAVPAPVVTPVVEQGDGQRQMILSAVCGRLLYVEDNHSNIRVLEQFVEHCPQLQLLVADEAFRGVYLARTERPDVIILDVNLPGLDGFEILSVLQRDPLTKDIPVLALSANAMSHDVEKGRQAGFCEYLTKPLNLEHLRSVLEGLLAPESAS